jgi:hypothetical protein
MSTITDIPSLASIARELTDWTHTDELVDALRSQAALLAEVGAGDTDPSVIVVDPTVLAPEHAPGWYASVSPGVEPIAADVPWRPEYVEIVPPERVTLLAEWGPAAAGEAAVGPLAITSPFRVLSAEGLGHLQAIVAELDDRAADFANDRVPRHSRGAIYRSEFLQGFHTDATILRFLSGLAGIRLEAHPNGHHASHFNFAPRELSKAVDPWHTDVTAFDAIMHVFDIDGMQGGSFEYYDGPAEEGRDALLGGGELPADRIVRPVFPGAGWMVLQQGNRVLHRAAPLRAPWRRCTYVPSFIAHHPTIDDPDVLGTLVTIDGPEVAPVEWARQRALVAARRIAAARLDDALADGGDARLRAAAAAQSPFLLAAAAAIEAPEAAEFINYERDARR